MASIYLVACTKKKQVKATPAKILYTSDWFKKAREYTLQHADAWYILSDKHGLVVPDKVLEPYESSVVKNGTVSEKQAWANDVLKNLLEVTKPEDTITILAGKAYRKYLVPELKKRGYTVHIPMEDLRIGYQLQWLKQALESK